MNERAVPDIPGFDRRFFDGTERFTRIGAGRVGGKAAGLLRIHEILLTRLPDDAFPGVEVGIPRLVVIATDMFDAFMKRNDLERVALSDEPDDRIAAAFQRADLPVELLGDLRALIEQVHQPLAVRSSSLLEDALFRPFAGVYGTKMLPNNQLDADSRFRRLVEAVKLVYASTFFADAKRYLRTTENTIRDEKMAVIVQEVVGRRHGDRFYPDISGVARSYNYYRSGRVRPEDGVVSLALGLGKTIVDGGLVWSYSPAAPRAAPPFASASERLEQTQTTFWAVNMGKPPAYDPIAETEYLVRAGLPEAEADGTLHRVASTYDHESDRLRPGVAAPGPRVVDFAPVLVHDALPLNPVIVRLLRDCEESLGEKVEIEFAVTVPDGASGSTRVGFLQVRPMVVSGGFVDVDENDLEAPGVVLATDDAMGNGVIDGIRDVVYVRPGGFESLMSRAAAAQIATFNDRLLEERRPYILIGFGRWGSSDPSLGLPVAWGQICGARVIVEASLTAMNVESSQGSHFFHNIAAFEVAYLCVRHDRPRGHRLDWAWLESQPSAGETELVRHVRAERPFVVKVDGRSGRGVVAPAVPPGASAS